MKEDREKDLLHTQAVAVNDIALIAMSKEIGVKMAVIWQFIALLSAYYAAICSINFGISVGTESKIKHTKYFE